MTGTLLSLSDAALARLMPMHAWLSPDGRIRRVGPTLQKLRPRLLLPGRPFFDLFEMRRPRSADTLAALMHEGGGRLHLSFRDPPQTQLKGQVVALPDGVLLDLSFGLSVVEAVAEYGLTLADFAATDLAVEMLFLVEAKTAVLEESRKLNQRLQAARIAAEERAFTDTLTGLKNRRAMDHVLARLVGAGHPFALMQLDLDYFKAVNDTLGHAVGDHVLQQVAQILVEETRETDTIVRIGGDEFVLIFDGLVQDKVLRRMAHRIIERLQEPICVDGKTCRISGSIGATLSTDYDPPDSEQMLADADRALYVSKHEGRGRVTMVSGGGANSSAA